MFPLVPLLLFPFSIMPVYFFIPLLLLVLLLGCVSPFVDFFSGSVFPRNIKNMQVTPGVAINYVFSSAPCRASEWGPAPRPTCTVLFLSAVQHLALAKQCYQNSSQSRSHHGSCFAVLSTLSLILKIAYSFCSSSL